jgi:hypothetical protein
MSLNLIQQKSETDREEITEMDAKQSDNLTMDTSIRDEDQPKTKERRTRSSRKIGGVTPKNAGGFSSQLK